jgi:Kef-type K+ transport system membrane component KefB
MLGSAFFTGAIGVHPIFGAFLAGLICPHEGGFAIKVTEKIEDLMGALFLPLYFTLSGLNTNLGLGVTVVAFTAKFAGCACAARLNGLVWRESFGIGSLMACKGLVELIVLNIGLQAKILSTRVFTIVSFLFSNNDIHQGPPRLWKVANVLVRRHGTHHDLCHHPARFSALPALVPEEA